MDTVWSYFDKAVSHTLKIQQGCANNAESTTPRIVDTYIEEVVKGGRAFKPDEVCHIIVHRV